MVENERSAKEPRTRRRKTQYRAENVKQNYRMKADRVDVQNRPTKLADRPPGLRVFQYVASIAEKHTTAPCYEHSVTTGGLQLATVVDYRSTLFDVDEYTVTTVKRFVDARCI